jgi:hypothetical protein
MFSQNVAVKVEPAAGVLRPIWRSGNVTALVVIGLLLLATVFSPVALRETCYRDFSYGKTCVAAASGEKPESKLWWNDGLWWAVLYSDAAHEYQIYKLNRELTQWDDSGVSVDDRPGSKSDAFWDDHYKKLYIASHIFVDVGNPTGNPEDWGRIYRYSYDPAAKTYSLDSGFPVTVTRGVCETMVLAKDSKGQLWVTYVQDSKVMVNHSLGDDDKTWATPFVLPVNERAVDLTTDDISSIIAFGGNSVGVMWSNQATMKMYFAIHRDGDPADTWRPEEIAYADSADDHINLKTDSAGRVYAAVKTSFEKYDEPLVLLLVRETEGKWSNHVFGLDRDHHTRPIVLLDEVDDRLYMFATAGGKVPAAEAGGAIYYKLSSMKNIDFGPGLGEEFIESPTDPLINNATSTKQNVDSTTGIVVLATDKTTHRYLHNLIKISASEARTH